MELKGVLFDMDGVIADTNEYHKKAIQLFCERHGFEVTDIFLREKIYGRINKEWIPALFGEMEEDRLKPLAEEKEALFRSLYAPHLEAVRGLRSFLRLLQEAGVKMAVATSAPGENATFILNGLSIRPYFQAVLDSSFVEHGKPNPEIYLKAAAELGFDPHNCIVIEDSLSGVSAGRRAGCPVIGITTTHTIDELSEANLVIDHFENIGLQDLKALMNGQ